MARRKKSSAKKAAEAVEKEIRKGNPWVIAIVVIIIAALIIYAYFNNGFDSIFGNKTSNNENFVKSGLSTEVTTLKNLKITFIDIGQGDCIYIEFPDGKNMLIDAGDNGSSYEETLSAHFPKNTTFDYVLATHSDSDHIGSMDYIYENDNVLYSFRPYEVSSYSGASSLTAEFNKGYYKCNTKNYYLYLSAIANEKTPYEYFSEYSDFANTAVYNGIDYKYTMDFLTPTLSAEGNYSSIKFTEPNEYSPYIMLIYGGKKVLFSGDAQGKTEDEFVSNYQGNNYADVDVYKVAHHGSEGTNSQDFLNIIKPEYSVISCGKGNDYGHPHQKALDRLESIDSQIYRTDVYGDITLEISDTGVMTWTYEKQADYTDNLIPGNLFT